MMNLKRAQKLNNCEPDNGAVIYWMSRDQRVYDNWALLYAQELALKYNEPLAVLFCLSTEYPGANIRHYDFMIKGLKEVEQNLKRLNIPFYLLVAGSPEIAVVKYIRDNNVGILVSDFDPLKIKRRWKESVIREINIPFIDVDTHNIIPCRKVSEKQEFAAYTIRPKIHRLMSEFMEEFPIPRKMPVHSSFPIRKNNWNDAYKLLHIDESVEIIDELIPGEDAALNTLDSFLKLRLPFYNDRRNDPNAKALSELSPYLHFGQIAPQRVALNAERYMSETAATEAFLEELIIRRELSDNFCFYNSEYDSFKGFPQWAQKTLDEHRGDKRPFIYSPEEFENAMTNDRLWNAAQIEMVIKGKMHGYMRMYWAKKILEWTPSPEEALKTAIYLNDKYNLDGRDPNGYAGIAWAIGGVHDRAWGEREIFGKIRYMSYNGCRQKFNVIEYINKHQIKKRD